MGAVIGAVVLAGGAGRRLGGADKPNLAVGGKRLIDRVLAALAGLDEVVVVGEVAVAAGVRVVREDPPGGGPAAAVVAGLAALSPRLTQVGLFAADLPFLDVAELVASATATTGALYADETGSAQWLCSLWPADALRYRAAQHPDSDGLPLRALLADMPAIRLTATTAPPPWYDCDTEETLAQARAWLEAM